jgi:hypothetical protein
VVAIILPLRQEIASAKADPKRLAMMKEQAAVWLAQQSPDAIRPPLRLSETDEQRMERDFDSALAAIRRHSGRLSEKEIAADVDEALAEARALSPDEQARLSGELETLLAEWNVHA